MKTLTRLFLIPVILIQITFSQQAQAKLENWQAALLGGVIGAGITLAVLSDRDHDQMNTAMRGTLRADLNLGDSVAWEGDHRGRYVYDARGVSKDGRYQNCRRLRPEAYDQGDRNMDMRNYPSTCACQTGDNRWVRIPEDQFETRQQLPPPGSQYVMDTEYTQNNPSVNYNNDSQNYPYEPFYSGRPLGAYQPQSCYSCNRPRPRPTPQYPQYPQYPQNSWDGSLLNFGINVSI